MRCVLVGIGSMGVSGHHLIVGNLTKDVGGFSPFPPAANAIGSGSSAAGRGFCKFRSIHLSYTCHF
eukprot:NODE_6748_length_345_cov_37.229730_g6021_i0.p2 GENE.NODE_6748_length_345_cov_37.229730_g6021_i0~~NODE_6748_length_345_cov_37.229730_g6021_i0.p2  ORF type:complete len:66 (+),score=8.83 NODE_6748_length_345_cov_37.229730_g6021_i0:45-242(+)